MLTPQDVRSVQFEKNLRGYRTEEVDRFLDKVEEQLTQSENEAEALRTAGDDPQTYVRRSPWLGRVLERMSRGYADGESYADLVSSLLYGGDPYLLLADFDDYAATHERLYAAIADPAARARLSLVNIARCGIFAADRAVREYADRLIEQFDVRSGQGAVTIARSMSGGNQQKAIIAREVDRDNPLIIAVQPTRGLDVGAIEYIHKQLVAQRDAGKAVLLVSLELDEVMSLSDRFLVMYEGQIVGELDPKQTTVQELGLYMSGAKRSGKDGESA